MTGDQRDEDRYDIARKGEVDIRVHEAEQSDTTRKSKETVTVPRGEGALVPHDPLEQYLYEIRKNPLLSREKEIELGHRVRKESDQDAAYILAISNLQHPFYCHKQCCTNQNKNDQIENHAPRSGTILYYPLK